VRCQGVGGISWTMAMSSQTRLGRRRLRHETRWSSNPYTSPALQKASGDRLKIRSIADTRSAADRQFHHTSWRIGPILRLLQPAMMQRSTMQWCASVAFPYAEVKVVPRGSMPARSAVMSVFAAAEPVVGINARLRSFGRRPAAGTGFTPSTLALAARPLASPPQKRH
jgi:hypothetical protein